jgi:hypothetical protein
MRPQVEASPERRRKGTLAVMVSCDDQAFEAVKPIVEVIGKVESRIRLGFCDPRPASPTTRTRI